MHSPDEDPLSYLESLQQPMPPRGHRFLFDQLPAPDANSFTLRLLSSHQLTHTSSVFYIEARLALYDPSYFNILVTSPSGFCPTVAVEPDVNYPRRYVCSFTAIEPGIYHVSVRLEEPSSFHITNSPCMVSISRDYLAGSGVAIMSRILTDGRQEGDAPGISISETSKIWGITNNPDAEKVSHQHTNFLFRILTALLRTNYLLCIIFQIYAADRDGHAILVFSTLRGKIHLESKFTARVPRNGKPFRPTGIDFCRQSQLLYVTDKDNHRVCIFKSGGTLISTFGSEGYEDGQFSFPWGVAVSPDGELVAVADSKNHRLQLFNKYGLYLRKYTVFEVNPFLYRDLSIGLDYPRGICFSGSGKN